jgi:hypothetical protein
MRKLISFAFALASFSATALPADRHIAFERNSAVYIANLDGTNEKKSARMEFFQRSHLMELMWRLTPSKKRATRLTRVIWRW